MLKKLMLKFQITIVLVVSMNYLAFAQNVGINSNGATPADCSMLDIVSATKGLLIPRVALTNVTTYAPLTGTPVDGMVVYSTANPTGGSGTGFYYWSTVVTAHWVSIVDNFGPGIPWILDGNTGTNDPGAPATYGTSLIGATENFVGTTDAQDLVFGTSTKERMRIKSGGSVGIGTASPNDLFEVFAPSGKSLLLGGGATTGSEIKFTNSGTAHFSIYNSGNSKLTFANTSALYQTNSGGTALGTFDASGNFAATSSVTVGTQGSDPAGTNGMIYYNSTTGKFRGYENGVWKDLISSGSSSTGWTASADIAYSRDDIAAWSAATGGDDVATSVNIPFNFAINGTNYTWVSLCSNGFMQFNTSNSSFVTSYGNGTLPSGSFSVPTLCFYWDDMTTTGNGIRYTTIGAAGNRTFVADFELVTYTGSYAITAQVQIHEGSNLVNIRYYTTNVLSCGQAATIGFQLSGTSALSISSDTKILDDNNNPQSISFCPGK